MSDRSQTHSHEPAGGEDDSSTEREGDDSHLHEDQKSPADVAPGFHPAGTRDRRLLWRTGAPEATAWTRPGRCFSISAAKAAGVA